MFSWPGVEALNPAGIAAGVRLLQIQIPKNGALGFRRRRTVLVPCFLACD